MEKHPKMPGLKIISKEDIPSDCSEPVNSKVLEQTRVIVNEIRSRGEAAFVEFATKYGDIKEGESYAYNKEELKTAFDSLPADQQGVLTRVVRAISCWIPPELLNMPYKACSQGTANVSLLHCA